jgi:hypothetical protein
LIYIKRDDEGSLNLASIPGGFDLKSETFLPTKIRATFGGATMAALLHAAASAARADDAVTILKSMTDYLVSQKTLSASFDSDIEIITPELQKIQFASSGQMKLNRPDKLRVRRTGGYADVELIYDGKTISIYGNNAKSYVQANLPGTVDQMVDALQERSGVGLPGTDLLLSDAFDVMMTTVLDGEHSVRASSTASNASISHFAVPTQTGRSGSRPEQSQCPANT